MKNTTFIKKNYKLSTISRMKELFSFTTEKDINESSQVTEALKKFEVFGTNPSQAQDILFKQIELEYSVPNTPSNIPTAKLRIKILQYVCQYEYYPTDWYIINELEKEMINDEITTEEYNKEIEKLLENWK